MHKDISPHNYIEERVDVFWLSDIEFVTESYIPETMEEVEILCDSQIGGCELVGPMTAKVHELAPENIKQIDPRRSKMARLLVESGLLYTFLVLLKCGSRLIHFEFKMLTVV